MPDYKELTEALSLVKDLCTSEQIQDLLRTRKSHESVRITAESKDDLVDRNLREAVESRAIEIENVFELIRSSEENGSQHIFYYKPKSKQIAESLTFDSVAQQLWRSNWKQTVEGFPAIRLKPNDYQYSDYRLLLKKPKDWVLKVYGDTTIQRATGKTEERGGYVYKEFIEEQLRIVLLARWNGYGLLEIRVQRNESRRRVEEWHKKMWEMLKPALLQSQFDIWELTKPINSLITNQAKNQKLYSFRDAKVFTEEGVRASFEMISDQGNLFISNATQDAIEGYLKKDGTCDGLTVTWLKQEDQKPLKDLRTLLVAKELNEIVVSAHCSSEELDYVTDQLRRFSK